MRDSQPAPSNSPAAVITDGAYTVDPARSMVTFRAKAFGLRWVRGSIPIDSGSFSVADGRLSGTGILAAHRISTRLGPRDWHLRTSHYLHTKKYPKITVALDDIDPAASDSLATVVVRDHAAPVQFELRAIEGADGQLQLEARTTMDRTVYPMLPPLAGVSRLVHIEVTVVAIPPHTRTQFAAPDARTTRRAR